jgi:hypothetical protein
VFDEDGDDLQPVILSEFQIVLCSPLSDVNRARQSLTVEQVRSASFARVLRAIYRLISRNIGFRLYLSARCICLVTEGVSSSARMQLEVGGWEIISVRAIESSSADIVEAKWRQTFTKLHLFSLTNFTQILYLDSDTIVKGSLQRAWLCNAPVCGAPDVFHPVFFNCGVLFLTPNRTKLQLLLKALPSLPAHESEQSALNEFFLTRFQPLHITLNFQKHR